MAHRNAPLSELGRLRLARTIVEQGWSEARAAERFQVSRPHRSARRTPTPVARKVVHLRWHQRLGPAQIAPRVGLAASTMHGILVRSRISRLASLDRATGQPVRRYEHPNPRAWSTSMSRS